MNGDYNEELSTFGKKVLNVLIKKWNRDKIRNGSTVSNRNMPAQSTLTIPAVKTHIKKVLIFESKEPLIQTSNSVPSDISHFEEPGIKIFEIAYPQSPRILENNYNIEVMTDRGPLPRVLIPTSNDLMHTLDATPTPPPPPPCHNNVTTHHLLRTMNRHDFNDNTTAILHTNVEKAFNVKTKQVNIDWQNMIDTEIISADTINDINAGNISTMNTNLQETNVVIHNKSNKTFEIHTEDERDTNKRKVQTKMTETVPKKYKKPTSESKNTHRKEKYTKTVKNWLNNVGINHGVNEQTSENTSDIDETNHSTIQYISDRDQLISNKKTVQTRLVNNDGIMKFSKPNNLDSRAAIQNTSDMELNIGRSENTVLDTENVANVKQSNEQAAEINPLVVTDKKTKRKYIPPIESQIPVKYVNYNITNVNADVCKHLNNIINNGRESDVFAVLIYSNNVSQLNNRNTEDAYTRMCEPAGILLNIEEQFYYFKGFHQSFTNVFKQLSEKNIRVICFDGKSILIYLKSQYNLDTHIFNIIDVKIGACILEPDTSVDNISELQKVLSLTPECRVATAPATECGLQETAWYTTVLKECALNLIRLLNENHLWTIFINIEMKLLPIIADMEHQGVQVDALKLKSMEATLLHRMKVVEQECYKAAGKPFQIKSTVQVRTIIYEELKLDAKCHVKIRETIALGAKSTSEAMLRSLISVHPLPKLILEYRHLHKAHATFLAGIAQHVKEGIVRPTWVQTAAVTGRIASNNPNLQAIPKTPFNLTLFPEGDAGNDTILFRSVYTSPAGWRVVAADFKHVECRVWANVAADGELLEALTAPDIFRHLAQLWLKKPEGEISTEDRERTKRMVYATLYGAGCRKLMDILELSYEQTLAVMASFNKTFPSLKSFGRSVVSSCLAADGDLRTACGRRRRFRHISSSDQMLKAQAERQAINFLVQGSAADLCKLAMVRSVEQLRSSRIDFKLVLQIYLFIYSEIQQLLKYYKI